jgi:hypothetical protein
MRGPYDMQQLQIDPYSQIPLNVTLVPRVAILLATRGADMFILIK